MANNLVECGDHGLAPAAITCVHLIEGSAKAAIPVPQPPGSEVENDWLCPACVERYVMPGGPQDDIQELRTVCFHCLRKIVEPYAGNAAT